MKKIFTILLTMAVSVSLLACQSTSEIKETETAHSAVSTETVSETATDQNSPAQESAVSDKTSASFTEPEDKESTENPAATETAEMTENKTETVTVLTNVITGGALETTDLFTERDLTQTADLSEAVSVTVSDGQNVEITTEGTYIVSGNASNATILVEVEDNEKVQIVLDGVTITNDDFPCIYVKNADKVFVTTTSTENSLSVTGTFSADGETNTDAVIFSKDDLTLNGTGTLNIYSSDNGITGKDDLKITGGTINIQCVSDALEANESLRIADGTITIVTDKDGIHVEMDEDDSTGYVYICQGTLNITAGDDGIHATTIVQIDGGNISISSEEGIEATWIQINGGNIYIEAGDDGINGARKSSAYNVNVEINGGELTISMGFGDTDAIDSNGSLYINGGTLNITAQSPFDYDGIAQYNGGTMIVNGEETTSITNQFMGGGMGSMGGPGGNNRGNGSDPGMGQNSGFDPGMDQNNGFGPGGFR